MFIELFLNIAFRNIKLCVKATLFRFRFRFLISYLRFPFHYISYNMRNRVDQGDGGMMDGTLRQTGNYGSREKLHLLSSGTQHDSLWLINKKIRLTKDSHFSLESKI